MKKITRFKDIPKFTSPGRYAVDYPLKSLVQWVKDAEREEGLQLNPVFQRGHVWTEDQQRRYIEFLLRGGRTGRDLYFNHPSWHHPARTEYNDFVCVDGLQRITAIQRFIGNEIDVFGSRYGEYTDSLRFFEDTMRVHINDLQTEEEVLAWYLEMNSGGTPHTEQELDRVRKLLEEKRKSLYTE